MKRKLFSLAFITLVTAGVNAQSKQELIKSFNSQTEQKNAKIDQLQSRGESTFLSNNRDVISSFTENDIQIEKVEDKRANATINVDELQNGGIRGFSLNGENMIIGVFDGGRVQDTHGEFRDTAIPNGSRIVDLENGAQGFSSHATAVSGIIGAEGRYTYQSSPINGITKGVLPKAVIKHAGFANTTNGNRFTKLLNYNIFITNHSYGVNNGWSQENATDGALGEGFYYPVNTTIMTDPNQTLAGAYQDNDASIDRIVYSNSDFIVVKSSGNYFGTVPGPTDPKYRWGVTTAGIGGFVPFNEGDIVPSANCVNNAYCIGNGSLAKNIIVVGAVDLPSTADFKVASTSDIARSSYSSVGPRKDGAIKPDVVAPGTLLYAPSYSATSITNAVRTSGTSFAAPMVTGVVGSLTQLKRLLSSNQSFNYKADEMKALLVHTTFESGNHEGPDNWNGWGLVNAKRAAEVVVNTHEGIDFLEKNIKEDGTNYEKLVAARTGEPIKVTLTWLDPEAAYIASTIDRMNDTTSKLINDFDLRIIDTVTNEIHLPWKLDLTNVTGAAVKGDNTVDNVEQITIAAPIEGRAYKIVVSNKGPLVNAQGAAANQAYTLLVTGAVEASLGTNDLKKSKVEVYPTVATDVVNVKTTSKINKVEVIDLSGKLISTTTKDVINVSALATGVYIINITTEEGTTSKKIIKQ